eukprot:2214714-Pleurochrysis_carterae.AAC.1
MAHHGRAGVGADSDGEEHAELSPREPIPRSHRWLQTEELASPFMSSLLPAFASNGKSYPRFRQRSCIARSRYPAAQHVLAKGLISNGPHLLI